MAVNKLPLYPGARARESLAPSQQASLNSAIASSLSQVLALPHDKRDKAASIAFISSYAKDHAQRTLHALIWEAETNAKNPSSLSKFSAVERTVHERTFRLAEKYANEVTLETLIDLAVVYGPTNPKRFRVLLQSVNTNDKLIQSIKAEATPAFTTLLASNVQGLYGIRKISYILLAFLRSAPPELVRPFARDKDFVLALAKAYDGGLATCVRSYGGLRAERLDAPDAPLDDWERIFLETKVALADSFHICLRTLLKDVEELNTPGPALAARCDIAFEIVFALLDLPPSNDTSDPVPFLNQSLLADYQHSYRLSKLLSEVTRRANIDDARTELLETTLQSLDISPNGTSSAQPGALKLLLRSSGIQPDIDNKGKGPSRTVDAKGKGKALVSTEEKEDPALDAAVAQVLDILPDQRPDYVRFVLAHADYPFKGNAERLVEALFEGTAPSVEEYESALRLVGSGAGAGDVEQTGAVRDETFVYTKERRNVFDEEVMDVSHLRVGKKRDDERAVLHDRAFIEQMKADILRRAEEVSEDEDEDAGDARERGMDVAFEDELDEGGLKVRDGEESEESGSGDEGDDEVKPKTPETILELAYIADPKVFERDAQTRRSKARQDLRAQTGWADEQIEGWRVMLERNPNKDKILQKHEFSGNRRGAILPPPQRPSSAPRGRGGSQGRGRGGGGGRGRGRGRGGSSHGNEGGSSGGAGDGGSARDRAYKDKNKASHANHNRKQGRDKKMARAGGPS